VNVTFGGAFTYDDYGDEGSPDGSNNREADIGEDSRWGCPRTRIPERQAALQLCGFEPAPLQSAGSQQRSGADAHPDLEAGFAAFHHAQGALLATNYPPAAVVDEYVYPNDPASGRYVPVPGRERIHFNLWLNKTVNGSAPSNGQPVEVVINDFAFTPDSQAPAITSAATASSVQGQGLITKSRPRTVPPPSAHRAAREPQCRCGQRFYLWDADQCRQL